jgi:hypothetical protein
MSGLDIFAWIVLVVLAASTIGVIIIAGALPGQIARSRGHPWAQAVAGGRRPGRRWWVDNPFRSHRMWPAR